MFELPEFTVLTGQINRTLKGKTLREGQLGNSPHKFVWYNKNHEEFRSIVRGKTIGEARTKAKWLFLPLNPGYMLLIGEFGGKILYHAPGTEIPEKYHLLLSFNDNSFLSATTSMWGALELFEKGEEIHRQGISGMRPTPADREFTFDYFEKLITEVSEGKKRSVKGLLTQDQLIPGLGNAITQDILFMARLHPKHPITELNSEQKLVLYNSILDTVRKVISRGGRNDEYDLFNNTGGYIRRMDKNAWDKPCPVCSNTVEKLQYLGGACYICPTCQK